MYLRLFSWLKQVLVTTNFCCLQNSIRRCPLSFRRLRPILQHSFLLSVLQLLHSSRPSLLNILFLTMIFYNKRVLYRADSLIIKNNDNKFNNSIDINEMKNEKTWNEVNYYNFWRTLLCNVSFIAMGNPSICPPYVCHKRALCKKLRQLWEQS